MTNDKGLIAEAARQPGAPPDFRDRAVEVLAGLASATLAAAVERAVELVGEVRAAVVA